MAFYMNLRRSKKNNAAAMELFGDCSLVFDDDRPTLSCNLFDSMRVDISLTCSICLVSCTSYNYSAILPCKLGLREQYILAILFLVTKVPHPLYLKSIIKLFIFQIFIHRIQCLIQSLFPVATYSATYAAVLLHL
jgi:hypothetical protein